MNYAALKAEIALPAYANLTDAQIAAALNAQTVQTIRNVPTSEARAALLATGEWGGVVLLARSTPSDQVPASVIGAAITAQATLELTSEIEATDAQKWTAAQTLLGALVTAGAVSGTTRDALLALRNVTTSRAAQLGLGEVRPGDVTTARAY